LMTASKQSQDVRQRKCPKHVEFFDKIKFGKFIRLVGFIKNKSLCSLRCSRTFDRCHDNLP